MNELWIHAGLPKSGSSALQVFFAKNHNKLKDEGVDYLDLESLNEASAGAITSGNGALLAKSLLSQGHPLLPPEAENIYDRFINRVKASESPAGLASSEFFSNISLDKLSRLKQDLVSLGVELKIIFYVRRQDQFLVSSYMQEVKRHGYTGSLSDFVESRYKKIHFLNYYGFCQQLANVLNERNLFVYKYDATKSVRGGIAGHFMNSMIGRIPDWVSAESAINTSPAPLELKLMLLANRFEPRMRFSDLLVDDSQRVGRSSYYPVHNIMNPSLSRAILDFFKDQNNKFFSKFCADRPFDIDVNQDYVDVDTLEYSATEVLDIMSGFLVRFDNRIAALEKKPGNKL